MANVNGFYDSEYARVFNKIELTIAQDLFLRRIERTSGERPSWKLSRWGTLRVTCGGKGYLVAKNGKPTLEYDL